MTLMLALGPTVGWQPQVVAATTTKTHVFKFYLDPALVPDMALAQQWLPKYVSDLNFVLAKNTNRQLTFDPATDIILTTTAPQSNSAGNLPTEGYEVWAHAVLSTTGFSHGGYVSFDQSGAAALAGMRWAGLYDPDTLLPDTPQMRDYWDQIKTMLHEYAHVYGAGMGEYYNLLKVTDTTGVSPILDIDFNNTTDPFWSTRRDRYSRDPLLFVSYNPAVAGGPASRELLLQSRFSPLTAAIMSGDYRTPTTAPPTVDLQNLKLQLVDAKTLAPIKNAKVRVWSIKAVPPYDNSLLINSVSSTSGEISFAWGGGTPHTSFNMLRLIKVEAPSYKPHAEYLSIYDTDEVKLVGDQNNYVLQIKLSRRK